MPLAKQLHLLRGEYLPLRIASGGQKAFVKNSPIDPLLKPSCKPSAGTAEQAVGQRLLEFSKADQQKGGVEQLCVFPAELRVGRGWRQLLGTLAQGWAHGNHY